jgi:hypothetical protein
MRMVKHFQELIGVTSPCELVIGIDATDAGI